MLLVPCEKEKGWKSYCYLIGEMKENKLFRESRKKDNWSGFWYDNGTPIVVVL